MLWSRPYIGTVAPAYGAYYQGLLSGQQQQQFQEVVDAQEQQQQQWQQHQHHCSPLYRH